jgi:acetone carboxylase beta subunit
LRANISAKGHNPAEFTCFSYGGAGPVHTYGYTEGVGFKDVVPAGRGRASRPLAAPAPTSSTATTSRWICGVSPSSPATPRRPQPATLQAAWEELAVKVIDEFVINGFKPEDVMLIPGYKMQYMGQLNDLEIVSPVSSASTAGLGQDRRGFETTYGCVHASSPARPSWAFDHRRHPARHGRDPETGAARRPGRRPDATRRPASAPAPSTATRNGSRPPWEDGSLKAGNHITGPAIIESDATTFVVPDGFETTIDKHRLFHLKEVKRRRPIRT